MSDVIGVVLKGYPRLSETFIAQELRGLEEAGHKLRLFSMRHPTDTRHHPIHDEIEAPVVYLPEYLHLEPLRVLAAIARLCWRPRFWLAAWQWLKDLTGEPTRNRVRRFGQGCVLAAELPSDVGRLYAHFIHTPAAVTHYASLMTG
ncbi:MAG: colanic acid biosynthesis glycosyltransferase WcaL, partial [Hyphomicrobiaceae bacterium]